MTNSLRIIKLLIIQLLFFSFVPIYLLYFVLKRPVFIVSSCHVSLKRIREFHFLSCSNKLEKKHSSVCFLGTLGCRYETPV